MEEERDAPRHDDFASSSTASCSGSTSYVYNDVVINHCSQDTHTFATYLKHSLETRGLYVFMEKFDSRNEDEVTSEMEAAISLTSVQIAVFSPNFAAMKRCLDALVHMKRSEVTILPVFYQVEPSELKWTGKAKNGPYAQSLRDHKVDSQTIQNWRDVLFEVSEISGFELKACNGDEELLLTKIVQSMFNVCPHLHYDVFINHRGPDTKNQFAGPLYDRLLSHGLRVFLDQEEFIDGIKITPQIEIAIQFASVQIAICSPLYAQSSWCLEELSLMTKSAGTILPVFYEVESSVLDGVYAAQDLARHEEVGRYELSTIQKWRDALEALSEVAKTKSFALDGNKDELLDSIVGSVLENVQNRSRGVQSSEVQSVVKSVLAGNDPNCCNVIQSSQVVQSEGGHYFELEKNLEDFEKMVLSESEEKQRMSVVGILGDDGAGKTTLAKEFLKRHKSNYNKYFLFDVREPYAGRRPLKDSAKMLFHNREKPVPAKMLFDRQFPNLIYHEFLKRFKSNYNKCFSLDVIRDPCANMLLDWQSPNSDDDDFNIKLDFANENDGGDDDVYNVDTDEVDDGNTYDRVAVDDEYDKEDAATDVVDATADVVDGTNDAADATADVVDVTTDVDRVDDKKEEDATADDSADRYRADAYAHRDDAYTYRADRYRYYGYPYRALVMLDNVNCKNQLDEWLQIINDLFRESLVLVTSREKDVLGRWIKNTSIYRLPRLNKVHSRMLFCSYAFLQGQQLRRFAHMVDEFLTACNGLPLLLKVVGARLCRKDISFWQELSNELPKCIQPDDIYHALQIVYDSLTQDDQQIFLDIACFFTGQDREKAIRIWGEKGFKRLEKMCLLEVDSKNKIKMHDHLKDLGRKIAKGLNMPRRLWRQTTKNISDLVEQSSSVIASVPFQFRGITMTSLFDFRERSRILNKACLRSKISYPKRSGEVFPNYDHSPDRNDLKFLAAQDAYLEEILWTVGSADLIWLHWYKCPYSYLPYWILMKNLLVLEVAGSELSELWRDGTQAPLELRELNIFAPLSVFPASIGQLERLEKIVVKYFWDRQLKITTLPEDFCRLRSLQYLELKGCSSMTSLPHSFGELTKLQYIDLEGASSLQMLPNSFGSLTSLKHLSLGGCNKIPELTGLKHLTCLETLDVRGCMELQSIRGLEHLTKIRTLDVSRCIKIPELLGLEHLTCLEMLDVSGCYMLQSIDGLGQLRELQTLIGFLWLGLESLDVSECQKLQSIQGLEQAGKLKCLVVSGCRKIEELPDLGHLCSLERLDAVGCQKLKSIQGLGQLAKLKTLNIDGCREIQRLPGLEHLTWLETLNVDGCRMIQELPSFQYLIRLKMLSAKGCEKLQSIQGWGKHTPLEELYVNGCREIPELPGLNDLNVLKILDVSGCESLKHIDGRGLICLQELYVGKYCDEHLTSLESLDVRKCKMLDSIDGLSHATKLKYLNVSGCSKIRELPGLKHLISLESLYAEECEKFCTIQELEQLTKLKTLNIDKCREIKMLPGLKHLTSLEMLSAKECEKLRSIEGLQHLTSLKTLSADGCVKLQGLQGLGELTKLEILNVNKCREIPELPGLEHLTSLKTLSAKGCVKLQSMQGLGQLTKLQTLIVNECLEIKELPGLENLTSLEKLDFGKCENLQRIQALGQLTKINILSVCECRELQELFECREIQGLQSSVEEHLTSLEELEVNKCGKIRIIQGLGEFTKLQTLSVQECHELQQLSGVEHLTSLEKLDVIKCEKLQRIQGLGQLSKLETVYVLECHEIQELFEYREIQELEPRVEEEILTSLKTLQVKKCKKLRSIGLGQLTELVELVVHTCHELQELRGVKHLTTLEALNVESCEKLETIQGLGQLKKLRRITVRDCREMPELPGVEDVILLKLLRVSGCPNLQWGAGVLQMLSKRDVTVEVEGFEEGLQAVEKRRRCEAEEGLQAVEKRRRCEAEEGLQEGRRRRFESTSNPSDMAE